MIQLCSTTIFVATSSLLEFFRGYVEAANRCPLDKRVPKPGGPRHNCVLCGMAFDSAAKVERRED